VDGKLAAPDRAGLDATLQSIWPEDDKRERFIRAAEQCVDAYKKLDLPHLLDRGNRRDRFERAAKASRAFADAIGELGNIEWQLIYQQLALEQCDGVVERRMKKAKELRLYLKAAPDRGLYFAQVFEDMMQKNPHLRASLARNRRAAEDTLLVGLMEAFACVDGHRPSAADNGLFSKIARAFLDAAAVELEYSQKRLKPLVARFSEFDPPPRGPRIRKK
jgi:hypothetical protein